MRIYDDMRGCTGGRAIIAGIRYWRGHAKLGVGLVSDWRQAIVLVMTGLPRCI